MALRPARKSALLVGIAIALLLVSATSGTIASRTAPTLAGSAPSEFATEQLAAARAAVDLTAGQTGLATDPSHLASLLQASPSAGSPSYRWQLVSPIPGQPAPRYFPNLVWDAADGYVVLYGGYDLETGYTYSDTWTYLNGTWTNITNTVSGQPAPVWGSGFAYDSSEHQVVLFGGNYEGFAQNDWTWAYHDKVWTNLTATAGTPPSPRVLAGLITDPAAGGGLLLFGGVSDSGVYNDTWTFVGDTWSNVTTTTGTPGLFPQGSYLVTNTAGGGPLLFGAVSENKSGDPPLIGGTYEFLAGAWKNMTATNPNAPIVGANEQGGTAGYLASVGAVVFYTYASENRSGGGHLGPFTWFFQGGAWVNETLAVGPMDNPLIALGSFVAPYDNAFVVLGGLSADTGTLSSEVWALAAPPELTISAAPRTIDAGSSVAFAGTVSLGLAGGSQAWTFGDGTNTTGASASHTYAVPGLYTANFTVIDLLGQVASISVAIQVNPDPSVGLLGPSGSAVAGNGVVFAALPRGGTPPFTYAWNFGNGVTSTSPAPTATYASAGTFTVTLTATDAFGKTATNSTSVTIAASSSGSSSTSLTSGTGLYLLLAVIVLLVVAILLGVMLARKGRGSRPPPTPYSPASPPGPPPGASGPPPPPP